MSVISLHMRNKSVNIDKISNGFTVDLDTPSETKDVWSTSETVFAEDLEQVFEVIRKFFA